MFSFVKYLSLIFILLLVGSCSIPEAQAPKKSTIILASDFLYAKDSILFANFEKQQNIKVKIKHLTADSILAHYTFYEYNSKFDGVLMYSTYTLNKLSIAHILHPLSKELIDAPKGAKSPNNDWIVFGLDPFVIDFGTDNTRNYAYNEFTHGFKWEPNLTKDESAAFFASVLHQFGRKNMYKSMTWMRSMKDHMYWTASDTLPKANFTLTRFSKAQKEYTNFVVPSQGRFGVFYDGIGTGIIKHSAKYSEITKLQLYLLNSFNNQALTGKLFIFPLENPKSHSDFKYQNDYPTFFRCSPNEASKEYRDLERILNKLDLKFPKESKKLNVKDSTLNENIVGGL